MLQSFDRILSSIRGDASRAADSLAPPSTEVLLRMGLQFTVGNPADVFVAEFAARVYSAFEKKLGGAVILNSTEPPYRSDECAWSGWSMLQDRGKIAIGASRIPQLLCMEAWRGCYVPAHIKPGFFTFGKEKLQLDVGSLPALILELESLGGALHWPLEDTDLQRLQRECTSHTETDIQVYAAVLLAGRIAQHRRQPLWIVK